MTFYFGKSSSSKKPSLEIPFSEPKTSFIKKKHKIANLVNFSQLFAITLKITIRHKTIHNETYRWLVSHKYREPIFTVFTMAWSVKTELWLHKVCVYFQNEMVDEISL